MIGRKEGGGNARTRDRGRKDHAGRNGEERRERARGGVSVSGSSLLHFKPKRGHSSGFRRADVLYYCSVEIAILRLHSGLRACMRRSPFNLSLRKSRLASLPHSQGNALEAHIRFCHVLVVSALNGVRRKLIGSSRAERAAR